MMEWASRTRRFDFVFAWIAALLLFASFFPTASVGFFESSILAALLFPLAAVFCFGDAFRVAAPKARPLWFTRLLAFLLLLWCLFQIAPLPSSLPLPAWMRWQGPADLFSEISSHSRFSLPLAVNPHASLHALLLWSALAFFAVAASRRLFHSRPRFLFLALFVVAALLEALFAFLVHDPSSPRIRGHFANSDAFANLMAMSAAVTLGLLLASCFHEAPRNSRSFARWLAGRTSFGAPPFWAAALLFQWVAIFASGSRGAALAALVASLFLLVPAAFGRPRLRRALLFALPVLLALGALFQYNAVRQNVLDRIQAGDAIQQIVPRGTIWRAAVRFVRDFPAGAGPDGTRSFLFHYQDPAAHGAYTLDYAHNDSLQFLGDLGIPGFALLLFLLLFVGIRAIRACRALPYAHDNRLSSSPWILRGCAAALVAALLHAQVEFNLSARPPLQLAFLLLAAILVSAGRPHPEKSSAPPHLSWVFATLLLLLALAASAVSVSSALSYRLARSVATAADIPVPPTDTPFLSPDPASPGNAVELLDRAARLDPLSPLVPLTRAHLPLALQRHDVQNAAATLVPDDPENEYAISRIALIFRPEEIERLVQARDAADLAVAAAPWDPQPLTLRAWILLRGIAINVFPPDVSRQALDDIRLAIALAPAEASLLEDAAQAFRFTVGADPGNLEQLFEIGNRVISLNPALTSDILALWWSAGASLDRIFTLPHLPTSCLWNLYRLSAASPASDRLAILDHIEASLDDPVLYPPESPESPWLPPVRPSASPAARQAHRARLVGERLRLRALLGDLPAIVASSSERAAERTRRDERLWEQAINPSFSRPIQLANLRRLFDAHSFTAACRARAALTLLETSPRDPALVAALRDAAAFGSLPEGAETVIDLLPPALAISTNDVAVPATVPGDSLDIPYLGEALILDSIAITPPSPESSAFQLVSSWRFQGSALPPNLAVGVTLFDPDQRRIVTRSALFESNCPTFFRGDPDFSQPCTLAIPLPKTASLARTVRISLSAGKSSFYPDDLRAHLTFDTTPLFPAPPPDTKSPAPAKTRRSRRSSSQPQPAPQPEPDPETQPSPENTPGNAPENTSAPAGNAAPQTPSDSSPVPETTPPPDPLPDQESPQAQQEPAPAPEPAPESKPESESEPDPHPRLVISPAPSDLLLLDPDLAAALVAPYDSEFEAELDRVIAEDLSASPAVAVPDSDPLPDDAAAPLPDNLGDDFVPVPLDADWPLLPAAPDSVPAYSPFLIPLPESDASDNISQTPEMEFFP